MIMKKKIEAILEESISVKKDLMASQLDVIEKAAAAVIRSLKAGGKIGRASCRERVYVLV